MVSNSTATEAKQFSNLVDEPRNLGNVLMLLVCLPIIPWMWSFTFIAYTWAKQHSAWIGASWRQLRPSVAEKDRNVPGPGRRRSSIHRLSISTVGTPAFTSADVGKLVCIGDNSVTVDGQVRNINWGGARHGMQGTIKSVDPKGKVVLENGKWFENGEKAPSDTHSVQLLGREVLVLNRTTIALFSFVVVGVPALAGIIGGMLVFNSILLRSGSTSDGSFFTAQSGLLPFLPTHPELELVTLVWQVALLCMEVEELVVAYRHQKAQPFF